MTLFAQLTRRGRRALIAVAVGGFLVVIVGFVVLFHGTADYPGGTAAAPTAITVTAGETGSQIALSLQSAGVVESRRTFVGILLNDSQGLGIAPGVHRIERHIPAKAALSELLDRNRIENIVVVRDGSTYAEVLKLLKSDPGVIANENLGNLILPLENPLNSLEGELAPAQYSFAPGTNTAAALEQMLLAAKSNFVSSGILSRYLKYTPYQLLTIASLIQIEADPSDYVKATRVILNRLAIGMPLQLNSTVLYAMHSSGHIGLSVAATHIDSPYNTYLHQGLPPTPISNPSLAALRAVCAPAAGNWLYFITVAPGDTRFTANYSQFEQWVALYNQNVAKGVFK